MGWQVSSQVHVSRQNTISRQTSCISLANNRLMDVIQLALTWVGWPNVEKLASTCVQIWSRLKWAQVNASARKPWPNGIASRPKFSTYVYLRLRLARALSYSMGFSHGYHTIIAFTQHSSYIRSPGYFSGLCYLFRSRYTKILWACVCLVTGPFKHSNGFAKIWILFVETLLWGQACDPTLNPYWDCTPEAGVTGSAFFVINSSIV